VPNDIAQPAVPVFSTSRTRRAFPPPPPPRRHDADAIHEVLVTGAILAEVRRLTRGLGIAGAVRPMHSATDTAVDLAIRGACRSFEAPARRRDVELRAVGPDLPLLPFDRGAICGVVINLVKNAIDACASGGHVTVDARTAGDRLLVSVEDDGAGMTTHVIAHCRELFFTTKEMASGVGLSLCDRVVEASGGSLSIKSILGHGTCVTVDLPIAPSRF
jgi:signal transduction histidine kinase